MKENRSLAPALTYVILNGVGKLNNNSTSVDSLECTCVFLVGEAGKPYLQKSSSSYACSATPSRHSSINSFMLKIERQTPQGRTETNS